MVVGAALRAAGRMMQWYCPVLRRESCEDADRPGFGRRADKCKIVRRWSRWWWPQYQRPRWTASWNATGRAADAWDPKKLCGATGAVGGSSSVAAGQSACKWRVACTVRKSAPACFFLPLGGTRNARSWLRTRYASSARGGSLQLRSQQTGPDGGCEQLQLQLQAVDPRARRAAQARDGLVRCLRRYRGSASGSRRVPGLGVEGRAVLGAQVTRLGFFLFLLLGGRSRCFGATGTGSVLGREKGEARPERKRDWKKSLALWVGGSTASASTSTGVLLYLQLQPAAWKPGGKSRGVQVPVPRGCCAMKTGAQGGA